jgi:hypothetical protein
MGDLVKPRLGVKFRIEESNPKSEEFQRLAATFREVISALAKKARRALERSEQTELNPRSDKRKLRARRRGMSKISKEIIIPESE